MAKITYIDKLGVLETLNDAKELVDSMLPQIDSLIIIIQTRNDTFSLASGTSNANLAAGLLLEAAVTRLGFRIHGKGDL